MNLQILAKTTFFLAYLINKQIYGNRTDKVCDDNNRAVCENEWESIIQRSLSFPSTLNYSEPKNYKRLTSILGNSYEAIVPSSELAELIAECSIKFSSKIPKEKHAAYARMIKTALPQRINHEVLSDIFLLRNFSILVLEDDEMKVDGISYNGIGGTFDNPSQTLTLNSMLFADDLWALQPALANELSHAGMLTIPGVKAHNIWPMMEVAYEAAEILIQEIDELNNKLSYLVHTIKNNLISTDDLKKQSEAIASFAPESEYFQQSAKNFHGFFTPVLLKKNQKNTALQAYQQGAKDLNDIYFLRNALSCSSDTNRCKGLFFYKKPQQHILDKVSGFYQQIMTYREKVYGENANELYAEKHHYKKAMELITFFDSLSMPLKEEFFPRTCEVLTSGYDLQRSYCRY